MKSKFKSILHNRNIHHTRGLGLPQRENPRPGGCAGSGILRECGYTPYACYGISLTTTTAAQPQFGKPQANFFKRKTP